MQRAAERPRPFRHPFETVACIVPGGRTSRTGDSRPPYPPAPGDPPHGGTTRPPFPPGPSSSTSTSRSPSPYRSRTLAARPPECRTVFVSASCTIRYAAASTPAGSARTAPEAATDTSNPADRARAASSSSRATLGAGASGADVSRSAPRTAPSSPSACPLTSRMAVSASRARSGCRSGGERRDAERRWLLTWHSVHARVMRRRPVSGPPPHGLTAPRPDRGTGPWESRRPVRRLRG